MYHARHNQSELLNAANLARALGVDGKTVARYLDLLVGLLFVRRLAPCHRNDGKRLVKSPKIYARDSGIVHALLRLSSLEDVLGHTVSGGSWEGMLIESLITAAPPWAETSFYRTSAGAEIDLILDLRGGERWAIEIKRSSAPKVDRGFYIACEDIQLTCRFVIYGGKERYRLSADIEAVGRGELVLDLARL